MSSQIQKLSYRQIFRQSGNVIYGPIFEEKNRKDEALHFYNPLRFK